MLQGMSISSFFTTGDGCRIAYRFDGRADKPVILSNSIGTSLSIWNIQISRLSERFRVLRYDTRGHGASGAPSGAYSADRLGWNVIELIDALKIDRANFCNWFPAHMLAANGSCVRHNRVISRIRS
jgi:3-oxoadipate enol-lactonase